MEIWQRFYNWLVPQSLQNQVEKKTQVNILVGVFLANMIICLLTLIFLESTLELSPYLRTLLRILTLTPVVLYVIAFILLKKTGSIAWSVNVAVAGIFFDDLFAVVITGGYTSSPLVGLFILAPLIAFLLAGHRSGVFWSVAVIASQLTLVFLEQSGQLSASSIADDQILSMLALAMPIILNVMLVVALYVFESINATLRHKLIGTNTVLEDHSAILDRQNKELERSKLVLLQKSQELEASGKYKSQFLSTMSHELRTPLNSILILSRALMDNRAGNLKAKEVEHASVINSAGTDLLNLINDILDLSKVEEGKLDLVYEKIPLIELAKDLERQFKFVAESKGLDFSVHIGNDLPPDIEIDIHRVNQILKNFISNAFKFTTKGGIYVDIYRPQSPFVSLEPHLSQNKAVVIAVRDTGNGIPKNKQDIIFEAFKQADGTTARKYGGTGLGLTISRQLAGLMKGEISVYSLGEGMGSTFGLIIPANAPEEVAVVDAYVDESSSPPTQPHAAEQAFAKPEASVDNAKFILAQPSEKILIVEDDKKFAKILLEMILDDKLDCDIVYTGSDCLAYLERFVPSAIILDLSLPDMSGWDILKKIKASKQHNHIPVRIISAMREQHKARSLGAKSFIEKPVSHSDIQDMLLHIKEEISDSFKKILIIEDSVELHKIIGEQFSDRGITVVFAENGNTALALMKTQSFDCFVVDLHLPDYDGIELLKVIRSLKDSEDKPIIVFTAMALTVEKEFEISRYADRVIVKSPRALDSLIETTGMFLHLLKKPGESADIAPDAPKSDASTDSEKSSESVFVPLRDYKAFVENGLEGCRILLVDDDIRNVYSMSAVLDGLGIVTTIATSGAEALEKISAASNIQLILMDIMMPEMDGYETTRRIRELPHYKNIPIIALTAKAMPEDRKLCLDAGANDYVTKPVDVEHLKRVMYTWLTETA